MFQAKLFQRHFVSLYDCSISFAIHRIYSSSNALSMRESEEQNEKCNSNMPFKLALYSLFSSMQIQMYYESSSLILIDAFILIDKLSSTPAFFILIKDLVQ